MKTLTVFNQGGQPETLGQHYRNTAEARAELIQRFGFKVTDTITDAETPDLVVFTLSHPQYKTAELRD